jgi:hypothetical protein
MGFYLDKPRPGCPDFIKLRLSLKAEDAIETIKKYTNDKGYVNMEMLKSKERRDEKDCGYYLQVNTYGLDKPAPIDRPATPDEEWRKEAPADLPHDSTDSAVPF